MQNSSTVKGNWLIKLELMIILELIVLVMELINIYRGPTMNLAQGLMLLHIPCHLVSL